MNIYISLNKSEKFDIMTAIVDIDTKRKMLFQLKRIRAVEETIAKKYSEGKMRCPTHLCTGQEAIAVGVCAALRNDDFVVSTHRSHGHYLAKGGDLKKMLAEIYGKATGCSGGKGGSMHLIDESVGFMGSTSIVGGTIPIGTGLGLSIKLNGTDQVSCVFFGDGATEEGVFYESLNFAVLKGLPLLYICENNFYSVYSPLHVRQPSGRNIFEMARCFGIESSKGDGNDVIDVYSIVSQSVDYIRTQGKPIFLEFTTYRWHEHCGPNFDNDIGYRTCEEYLWWRGKDPIALLINNIKNNNEIGDPEIKNIEKIITEEVNEAFHFAEISQFPHSEDAFTQLFKL